MGNPNGLKFNVDINVINHLGVGLYSSTPAALTELVANAWDAEAEEVNLTIDPPARKIIIEDDGHGMDIHSIKGKFLNVGFSRRTSSSGRVDTSLTGKRHVMGRKGIGKLAMFALADEVKITSQTQGGSPISFVINVPKLRESIKTGTPILLEEEDAPTPLPKGQGTRIELSHVLNGLNTTEGYLRVKLARRFSIIGPQHNFVVKLNSNPIVDSDRGFFQHIQFLWPFDERTKTELPKLCTGLAKIVDEENHTEHVCISPLSDEVVVEGQSYKITGYIASVAQPKNLGKEEESANIISVFANGRVFAEDVLTEFGSAKYYKNYLVGEVHADFLDRDDTDRATASREAIKKDDPKFRALITTLNAHLESIGDQWDEWRTELGIDKGNEAHAAITEWLDSIPAKKDQRAAKKLMTSIQNSKIHADDEKNEKAKKILYRGAIIGFEKLRIRNQLDRLTQITDVLSPEFAAIFSALNDVEEAAYSEITHQRLEVIKKFKEIAGDPDALEKVAQQYLFDNLWLLDPSWDRVTGRGEMEKTLTNHIKTLDPDSEGARLDITYRASSGRHIVVELKRPRLTNLKYDTLYPQARKYKLAVEQYYRDTYPGVPAPALDIYLLISKTPVIFTEDDRESLAKQNAQIITYNQLINDAYNAYQEYIDAKSATGKISDIFSKLS
jgi:hypothetical protein